MTESATDAQRRDRANEWARIVWKSFKDLRMGMTWKSDMGGLESKINLAVGKYKKHLENWHCLGHDYGELLMLLLTVDFLLSSLHLLESPVCRYSLIGK